LISPGCNQKPQQKELESKKEYAMKTASLAVIVLGLWTVPVLGQVQRTDPPQGQVQVERTGQVPIYRVTVVARTTKAINYRHRSGSTKVDFRGTALMPQARGVAKVDSKQGRIQIDTKFDGLTPATQFGPEYLTYVLWAITPEGRANNLGEVLLGGTESKLGVTTDLQAFGLIVTAEPYFAVTQPSDVVVMENIVREDTVGKTEQIDAKYELLQRGQYTLNVSPSDLRPIQLDPRVPLELYEARNAVRIARWTGADRYAAESFQKAVQMLAQAENDQVNKTGKKPVIQTAREVAQTAEDARIIAVKRQDEERQANERALAAQREAQARTQAQEASQQSAQARTERDAAERAKEQAQAATEQARREKSEAEAARAAALAQQQTAQAETEKARLAAEESDRRRQQAEQDQAALRAQLLEQFNAILATRETARGLIVNMSDVLFDTGKYTLRPGAREKLAKIAGILLAHPGLYLEVEGHTDSVGSDEYNQQLSERRAGAVRDYLANQGISMNSLSARGFGKTQPVTSNDTATGRQQNRRVELVVSGEVIGVQVGATRTPRPPR